MKGEKKIKRALASGLSWVGFQAANSYLSSGTVGGKRRENAKPRGRGGGKKRYKTKTPIDGCSLKNKKKGEKRDISFSRIRNSKRDGRLQAAAVRVGGKKSIPIKSPVGD